MSSTRWTEDQKKAIETSDCNLLVAAAAGSGKTAVLVERIIRKVIGNAEQEKGASIDIDKLLVVTFTNAAASEMRERIGDALGKELDKTPESKVLQKQLTLLNKANITTIHSFCLGVIRNNFHVIDIDPNFRIGDETEGILLKNETLEELFEKKYEEKDKNFLRLIDCYGERNDIKVQNMVMDLYHFAKSSPWYDEWLIECAENFNVKEDFSFEDTEWAKILMENVKIELLGLREKLKKAINIIKYSEGIEHYLIVFEEDLVNINSLIESSNDWRKLSLSFNDMEFSKLPVKRGKDIDKEAQEKVKEIRDDVKKKINVIKEDIFSNVDSIADNLRQLYPVIRALADLVLEFDLAYSAKKKEKSIIDFSDIEHFCLNILVEREKDGNIKPSKIAEEYKDFFEEILIDEYQDSNLVQEVILTSISRNDGYKGLKPNVFMVGDVKQSIYRFRQAKPELFLKKYHSYSELEDSDYRKIKLFKNFRSRKEVLDGVNFIFKQIMSENIGELEYDEGEYLNLGAEFKLVDRGRKLEDRGERIEDRGQRTEDREERGEEISVVCGGAVELHLMDKNDSKDEEELGFEEDSDGEDIELGEDEEQEELNSVQLEARMVGEIINRLIKGATNGASLKGSEEQLEEDFNSDGEDYALNKKEEFRVWDKNLNAYRKVKYKDIVILMRATEKSSPVFIEELTAKGIPAFADTSSGYFNTFEIRIILSLLQIIDNPIQDIPLLAVLRSPIASFSAEELIDIRLIDKNISFYEVMRIIERKHNNSLEVSEVETYNFNNMNKDTIKKVNDFLITLKKWREKSLYMSIDEFIWFLYTETGFYGYAGAMPGGIQKQANLRILFERARQFEETSYKGLFNFINFIDKLKKNNGDMGSAKIIGENEDVVRIISIHKSKGLEFPVVILAGTGKKFNFMDMNKSVLFHQELGIGPNFVDSERRISYPTVLKGVLKRKIKIETLSEEMRILYVAMTRAKEKLIITGMVKDINKTASKWYGAVEGNNKLPDYWRLGSQTYLDWIAPAVMSHEDGEKLRVLAGVDNNKNINKEASKWKIKIWNRDDVTSGVQEEEEESEIDVIKELESIEFTEEHLKYREEVSKRMDWVYKYKESTSIPNKVTVSELKRKFNTFDEGDYSVAETLEKKPIALKKPIFLEKEKKFTGAEIGTLMHLVMQHVDINKTSSVDEITEQVYKMIVDEFITEEQSKVINVNKIYKFFNSDLGKRMKASNNIRREIPFYIEISSTEVYKDLPKDIYEGEKVLLQGVIDCYFEEHDGLVIVDYKTDYIDDIESIKEKYRIQLQYYKQALEKMTEKNVKSKCLYLFYNGKICEIN